jgi:hypothetical protein
MMAALQEPKITMESTPETDDLGANVESDKDPDAERMSWQNMKWTNNQKMATQEFKVKMCAEDMNRAAVILK